MRGAQSGSASIDRRIAQRLRGLRAERNWSLDALARRSGVSRATLSRLENAEVSPTANVLGRLCAAYGLTMSRLLSMVEEGFSPVVRRDSQTLWTDVRSGFTRRSVSPPAGGLAAEVLECALKPRTRVTYDVPPVPGLEHHLIMLEGCLEVTVGGEQHRLNAGDCVRYRLFGATEFRAAEDGIAKYILVLV